MTCIKYTFFFFNFLFWVLGALALGVGIWAATDKGFESTINDVLALEDNLHLSTLKQAAYLMIIAGAVMMAIGFCGCIGAVRESTCLLSLFFILLLLVCALCVAIIVLVFVNPHLTDSVTIPIFINLIKTHTANANNSSMDLIQKNLKCCGADGREDWLHNNKTIPASCGAHTEGCSHALHKRIQNSFADYPAETGAVTALVLAVIVAGMILSITLCCVIRRDRDNFEDEEFRAV